VSSELNQNRYDQLLRRVGAMIGPGSRVVEALTELFPVIEVENLQPELFALVGTRLCWQSTERPPAAGQNAGSQLFNPVDSNVIGTVTRVRIRCAAASAINVELQDTEFGASPVSGLFRDSRLGFDRETTLRAGAQDPVTVGGGLRLQIAAGDTIFIEDINGVAVLAPGSGLSIGTTAQNTTLTVNYWWRERSAEQSELNF